MQNRNKIVQIVIFLGIVLVGGYVLWTSLFRQAEGPPKVGDQAPNFKLFSLEGKEQQLSDLKGKPVVINFWGSFCPPCVKEMPLIEDQYQKWKDQGLVVLGVNLSESQVTVKSFVRDRGVTFPILLDRDDETRKKYGVTSFPTTFFVKPDGTISQIIIGEMAAGTQDSRDMELALTRLMEEQ